MIHHAFRSSDDPDRNWQTREAAKALEDARHARNVELQRFWADVFAVVAMASVVAWFLAIAARDGLFDGVMAALTAAIQGNR